MKCDEQRNRKMKCDEQRNIDSLDFYKPWLFRILQTPRGLPMAVSYGMGDFLVFFELEVDFVPV